MKRLSTIVGLEKRNLVIEKTGEVRPMCVVTYLTTRDENDSSCGCDVRTSWISGDNYDKLKRYLHKPIHELVYTTKLEKNMDKYVLQKFADVELRSQN